MVGPSKSRPPMSHRKTDLGIPCRSKSAKVVLGRVLINAGNGRMSALGANRTRRDGGNDVNDPGCVKTHTSAKCRKHNSPARHRTSRVQYNLTLRDAIDQRYFYVWRARWSFRTAK